MSDEVKERRVIKVTERNLWFLERSIPLFNILEFFPADALGPPDLGDRSSWDKPVKKITLETDLGWSIATDIASDSKVFRNRSKLRGTGKWVISSNLKAGDSIIIEKIDDYKYRLIKEKGLDKAD